MFRRWNCPKCGHSNLEEEKEGVINRFSEECERCEILRYSASKRYVEKVKMNYDVWKRACSMVVEPMENFYCEKCQVHITARRKEHMSKHIKES